MDALQPVVYEIRIQGHLENHRADWFGDMTITRLPDGPTVLTGTVVDQAALHGLLSRIRDIGALLISVQRLDSPPSLKQAT